MDNVFVSDPKLTIYALQCEENKTVFAPLLENKQVLKQARVSLKWLTDKEMLQVLPSPPKTKEVYVIPCFNDNDPIYSHLHNFEHMIWGSPVIGYCSKREMPLPDKPRELYSMAFKDVVVSFTGLDPELKEAEGKRINLMGGTVSPDFSVSVDLLIAKNCESTPKYRGAFCWKKPICHLRIIDALWRDGSRHVNERVNDEFNEFTIPILTDCVISVSGIEMNERNAIGGAIEENGGRYVSDMEKGICTHLITDKTSGDKYKFANKWSDIKIVTTRWLRKCLDRKMRLPEEYYHPDASIRKVVSRGGTNAERQNVVPETQRKPHVSPVFARPILNPINFDASKNVSGPLGPVAFDSSTYAENATFDNASQSNVLVNNTEMHKTGPVQNNISSVVENIDGQLKNVKIEDVSTREIKTEEIEVNMANLQTQNLSENQTALELSSVAFQNEESCHTYTKNAEHQTNASADCSNLHTAANITYDVSRPVVGNLSIANNETTVNDETIVNEQTETQATTAVLDGSHLNDDGTKVIDVADELEDGELETSVQNQTRESAVLLADNYVVYEEIEVGANEEVSAESTDGELETTDHNEETTQQECQLSAETTQNKTVNEETTQQNDTSVTLKTIRSRRNETNTTSMNSTQLSTQQNDTSVTLMDSTKVSTQQNTTSMNSTKASTQQNTTSNDSTRMTTRSRRNDTSVTLMDSTKTTSNDSTRMTIRSRRNETNATSMNSTELSTQQNATSMNSTELSNQHNDTSATLMNSTKTSTRANSTKASSRNQTNKSFANSTKAAELTQQLEDETSTSNAETTKNNQTTLYESTKMEATNAEVDQEEELETSEQNPNQSSFANQQDISAYNSMLQAYSYHDPTLMDIAANEEVVAESLEEGELETTELEEGQLEKTELEDGELEATNICSQRTQNDNPTSKSMFARASHAPDSYMTGTKEPARRMRLRINTSTWQSQLLDKTMSSGHNESAHEETQGDETLKPEFIKEMLEKAARNQHKNASAPLSILNGSQVPEELRPCYRQSAFPPPQFSPMSIDDDDMTKENQGN